MKKLIALLLAMVMVIGLVACGSSTAKETEAPAAAPAETAAPAGTEVPAEAAAAGSVYYLNFKPE
ncbi:MAG: carbohydrate ABC transporter substrate-binding protein, partial [Faecousia sp.]